MDDETLAVRAAGGDEVAFELLVRRHAEGLWRLARSVLDDDQLAEEAVQDAFVKAHRALGDFRGASSLKSWLASICYRTAIDRVRVRRLRVVPLDGAAPRASTQDLDLRVVLREAVDDLPPDEREAFQLVGILGYTREEAAAIVGVPSSTLRSRVARARERLAAALAPAQPSAAEGGAS